MTIDWGNAPSWVSAVGSTFAAVMASLAARAAWRQVKNSDATLNRTLLDRDREQANKVAAWLEADTEFREGEKPRMVFRYCFINKSDLPVYNVHIVPAAVPDKSTFVKALPPDGTVRKEENEELADKSLEIIRPVADEVEKELGEDAGVDAFFRLFNIFPHFVESQGVAFSFRDMTPRDWSRDAEGNLIAGRPDWIEDGRLDATIPTEELFGTLKEMMRKQYSAGVVALDE
ncbi:hypothetical protein AB0L88_33460 [Saccharopolyspora shandongensis]|uniref:hypothetical protein n=1 Tax=Saccharopolyspora shandongensis TaxID=418495 RepID=UPI0034241652